MGFIKTKITSRARAIGSSTLKYKFLKSNSSTTTINTPLHKLKYKYD